MRGEPAAPGPRSCSPASSRSLSAPGGAPGLVTFRPMNGPRPFLGLAIALLLAAAPPARKARVRRPRPRGARGAGAARPRRCLLLPLLDLLRRRLRRRRRLEECQESGRARFVVPGDIRSRPADDRSHEAGGARLRELEGGRRPRIGGDPRREGHGGGGEAVGKRNVACDAVWELRGALGAPRRGAGGPADSITRIFRRAICAFASTRRGSAARGAAGSIASSSSRSRAAVTSPPKAVPRGAEPRRAVRRRSWRGSPRISRASTPVPSSSAPPRAPDSWESSPTRPGRLIPTKPRRPARAAGARRGAPRESLGRRRARDRRPRGDGLGVAGTSSAFRWESGTPTNRLRGPIPLGCALPPLLRRRGGVLDARVAGGWRAASCSIPRSEGFPRDVEVGRRGYQVCDQRRRRGGAHARRKRGIPRSQLSPRLRSREVPPRGAQESGGGRPHQADDWDDLWRKGNQVRACAIGSTVAHMVNIPKSAQLQVLESLRGRGQGLPKNLESGFEVAGSDPDVLVQVELRGLMRASAEMANGLQKKAIPTILRGDPLPLRFQLSGEWHRLRRGGLARRARRDRPRSRPGALRKDGIGDHRAEANPNDPRARARDRVRGGLRGGPFARRAAGAHRPPGDAAPRRRDARRPTLGVRARADAREGAPAVCVALVDGNGPIWEAGFGFADPDARKRRPHTRSSAPDRSRSSSPTSHSSNSWRRSRSTSTIR